MPSEDEEGLTKEAMPALSTAMPIKKAKRRDAR